MVLDDCEDNLTVLVLKFGAVDNLFEQACNVARRVMESATAESSKYQGVMSVCKTDTEDGAHLAFRELKILAYDFFFIWSQLWLVYCSNGNEGQLERVCQEWEIILDTSA